MRSVHLASVFAPALSGAIVLGSVFSAASARAESHFGAGLIGAVGGNFLDKPDRGPADPDIYPGYGGLTIGGGLMLDGRILDGLLGLEVDVMRTSDKGSGTVNFSTNIAGQTFSTSIKQTIGQSAWHVPILAKITFPSPLIAPMVFIGPELVFPGSGSSDPSSEGAYQLKAHADNYVMVTFGAGVEIKLPLPILDLRIPLGIRGSYNPSAPSSFSDRVKGNLLTGPLTYYSGWKYDVNFTAGAAIYF